MLHRNNIKHIVVSLGFVLSTNSVLLLSSNRDNALSMLIPLGFDSGTRLYLGNNSRAEGEVIIVVSSNRVFCHCIYFISFVKNV